MNRCDIFTDHLDIDTFGGKFSDNFDVLLATFLGFLQSDHFVAVFGNCGFAFAAVSGVFVELFILKNTKLKINNGD